MGNPGSDPRAASFFLQRPISSMTGPGTPRFVASVVAPLQGDLLKLKSLMSARTLIILGFEERARPRYSRRRGSNSGKDLRVPSSLAKSHPVCLSSTWSLLRRSLHIHRLFGNPLAVSTERGRQCQHRPVSPLKRPCKVTIICGEG